MDTQAEQPTAAFRRLAVVLLLLSMGFLSDRWATVANGQPTPSPLAATALHGESILAGSNSRNSQAVLPANQSPEPPSPQRFSNAVEAGDERLGDAPPLPTVVWPADAGWPADEAWAADGATEDKKASWFDKYSIGGYAQIRLNEIVHDSGPAAAQHVGDSSIGAHESFLLRRARLVLSGDVNDYLSVYLQPDFASTISGSADANHYVQMRDWYADIHLDRDREHRLRVGQSKLPFGWENLQSSRNRLPLDRNDALSSSSKNERDLGVIYYWTPLAVQQFFDAVDDQGLKGSGNYGLFGLGVYNGQGGSQRGQNDDLHVISRLTLPYTTADGQMMEFGVQGYTGRYGVMTAPISPQGIGPALHPQVAADGIDDRRLAVTWVYYAQPLGFQTEWMVGRGPGLSEDQRRVTARSLQGGYAMVFYRQMTDDWGQWWPFARWNYLDGYYKTERNAPQAAIDEWEFGCEWQMTDHLELVAAYTVTDRTNTDAISAAGRLSYQQFRGDFLRFQLQFSY